MPGAMELLERLRNIAADSGADAKASAIAGGSKQVGGGDGDSEDDKNDHDDHNGNNKTNHNHSHSHKHSSSNENEVFLSAVRREISAHITTVLAQCAHTTGSAHLSRQSDPPHVSVTSPPSTSPHDVSGNHAVGAPLSPQAGQRPGLGQGSAQGLGLARALVRSLPSSPSRSMSLHLSPPPAASSSSASSAVAAASSPSRGPPPASFQERLSSNLQKLMRSPSPELFRQNNMYPSTPHPPTHPSTLSPQRGNSNAPPNTQTGGDGGDGSALDSARSPSWSQSFLRSVSSTRARSHSPSGHSSTHSQQQQQSLLHQLQQQRGIHIHGSAPFNGFACCSSCSVVHVSRAMSVVSQMPHSNPTAPNHISQSNLTPSSQMFQSKIMHASQSAMSAIIAGYPSAFNLSSSSSPSPSSAAPPSLSFLQRVAATQVRFKQPPTPTIHRCSSSRSSS